MTPKQLLFLLGIILVSACTETDIKKYVEKERVDIRTISPDSTDFSDLTSIGEAIGDARIVLLGEQDHGDAPAFLAKSRLVKYLHEKKGFNVLAFESDFFALNHGWDTLEKQENKMNSFLFNNLFSSWTKCKECENLLYNYIPKTFEDKKPLVITGFDNQIYGTYSLTNLRVFIENYLKRINIPYSRTEKYQLNFLPFLDVIKYNKDIQKQKNFYESLNQIISEIPAKDSITYEMMLLKSLKGLTESEISYLSTRTDYSLNTTWSNIDYMEIRDKQMADNLKWLLKHKFPNEKIIVWAHNIHILKNPELINADYILPKNMGSYIAKDQKLNNQAYFLGFNSRVGSSGRVIIEEKFRVEPIAENSFESWIPESVPYAFIDFKKFREKWNNEKKYFLMKGVHHTTASASWTDVYDGIFYIRDMYPCSLGKEIK